jgi:hypothetical protein
VCCRPLIWGTYGAIDGGVEMLKKLQFCAQIVGFATLILLSAVGALALTGNGFPAWAQAGPLTTLSGVPNVISYQGILRSTDGTPVDGPRDITLRLYTTPSGGEAIHKETWANEMVRAGLFTVLLGDQSGNPIPASAFRKPLYVSVQVGKGQEMAPRQRIAPVPYAVQLTDGIYVDRDGNGVNVIVGDGASPAHMVIPQGGLCVSAQGDCSPQTGTVKADRVEAEELKAQALSAEHIHLLGSPEEDGIAVKLDVAGNVRVTGGVDATGVVNAAGFTYSGAKPFKFVNYTSLGDSVNYDTGVSTADWHAAIVGFKAADGDIQESGWGDIIQVYMYELQGTWWIRADFRSHNTHEKWDVNVMYVSKQLVQ